MKNKKTIAYLGLSFVVFVWGTAPLTSKYFLDFYSPTFGVAWTSMVSVVVLAAILRKKLKYITVDYFKVAVPLGIFYASANLSQKIGLQYTTPTVYSFLENLSCIVVPLLIWWFTKKRPTVFHIIGSIVCLISAFVLSGLGTSGETFSLGSGVILCALAGVLYGVNIAGTGVFTKKFDSALYIMILLGVESILSLIASIAFNYININGAPIEIIRFSWNPVLLFARVAVILITSTLCWVIRTNSMKHIDATVVAIMMPFSSVVASVLSVLFGMDKLTLNLVVGAVLGMAAMLICSFGDILSIKKSSKKI